MGALRRNLVVALSLAAPAWCALPTQGIAQEAGDSGQSSSLQPAAIAGPDSTSDTASSSPAAALQSRAAQQTAEAPQPAADPTSPGGSGLGEVLVTATRRAQPLSKVPLTVQAVTSDQMDMMGINTASALFMTTPGVTFSPSALFGTASISIRGISASSGAATTGIYLDDTPIQVRQTGTNSSQNFYPEPVDVQRVEVLQGPQGTLFGAGAEGGAIRFILPEPDLQRSNLYLKTYDDYTQHGAPGAEVAGMISEPLFQGKLAASVAVSYRRDGGWVDIVDGNGNTTDPNSNSNDAQTARLAVKYAVTDNITITPSYYYQQNSRNNQGLYWPSISDPSAGVYESGQKFPSSYRSRFTLPALKIQADVGPVQIFANTSYFDGSDHITSDYSAFVPGLLGLTETPVGSAIQYSVTSNPVLPATGAVVIPNYVNPALVSSSHKFFAQEFRVQSTAFEDRLQWLVGLFYMRSIEQAGPFLDYSNSVPGNWNSLCAVVPASDRNVYCTVPLADGLYSYDGVNFSHESQKAIFGDFTYAILRKLKLNLGFRYQGTDFAFQQISSGPFGGGGASGGGAESEHPFTPKYGLSYQFNNSNMVYASATEGFRTGGSNYALPTACNAQAEEFGLQNTGSYKSDTVWSYEIGSKNSMMDDRLALQSSVYYLKWNGIQQSVSLPCGFGVIQNLGQATSKGFSLQAQFAPTTHINVYANLAYVDAQYSKTLYSPGSTTKILARQGVHLPAVPWTAAAGAQYNLSAFNTPAYLRADFQWQSAYPTTSPTDPLTLGYNSYNIVLPSVDSLNLRAGVIVDDWDLSAFVTNALNGTAIIGDVRQEANHNFVNLDVGQTPRTIGVQAVFHY
jgi:iron complex outermembrane receptor protein